MKTALFACVTIVLVLAVACACFPSWPLAFALAVVATLGIALLVVQTWEADRVRGAAKVAAEVTEIRAAVREHAEAIADLKRALFARKLSEEDRGLGGGTSFPRG